jgi:hypothetical protein
MNFFYFCGSFLPSWIRIRIRIQITDPDPIVRLNTDPIRIRIHNTAEKDHKYFSVCIIYCWTLGCSISIKYTVSFPAIGLVLSYPFSHVNVSLLTRARFGKRLRSPRIVSASLCSLAVRYDNPHRLIDFRSEPQ